MMPRRSIPACPIGLTLFLITLVACSTGPTNDDLEGIPAAVVRTEHHATITHENGWELSIPRGAVPLDKAGESGEMLFSMEEGDLTTLAMPSAAPPGWALAGSPLDLGPSWMTMAIPVTVSLPVPASMDVGAVELCLFAYDGIASRWVAQGGGIRAGQLSADLLELGRHVLMTRPRTPAAWGALAFGAVPGYGFVVSIREARLGYFPEDAAFDPSWWHVHVPCQEDNDPAGIQRYVPVPQGIYRLALGVYRAPDGAYLGFGETTVTVAEPHTEPGAPESDAYAYAVSVGDLAWWTDESHLDPGVQPGVPPTTPSVGIGAVNVRLEWTAPADLDLWVVDPCGNRLYDGVPVAVCGDAIGRIDMENQCARLVRGKPENAFWHTPARGVYAVYVDYYADCGGAGRIPFTLRWMTRGVVHSLHGSLLPPEGEGVVGDEVKLAEFRY